jgi:type II secretory pathway component PulK
MMRYCPHSPSCFAASRRRGVALILALIVSTLLTIIVMEFVYSTTIDLAQATRYRDEAQVIQAVRSAQVFSEVVLKYDKTRGEDKAFDSLDDIWNTVMMPGAVGEAGILVTITDESSKLNLLNLVHPDEEWAETWKEAFVRLCTQIREGVDGEDYEAIADDVIDYMKEDKQFNPDDDEDVWSGAPILSIDELVGVGNITAAFLYGNPDRDNPDLANIPGMWDFLTIYSHGAINLNTARAEIIRCLHENLTEQLAADIVSRREELDESGERKLIYRGKTELSEVEGMEAPSDPANLQSPTLAEAISPLITTRTGFFLVEVEVTMRDVSRVFRVYYKRVNRKLFRLSLAEIQPSRLPLQDQGVDLEDFDPYRR